MRKPVNKKRRIPIFYLILLICVLLGIVAVSVGLSKVTDFLRVYEEALPKYTAEEVCSTYFRHPNCEVIFDKAGGTLSRFESGDAMTKSVQAWLGDETLTCKPVTSDMAGETLRYSVRAGERLLGTFTLKKSGETASYHRPLYVLDTVTYTYQPSSLFLRITAPLGVQLTVNGVPLEESLRDAERDMATASCAYMPEGVQGLIYGTYILSGFLEEPTLTATYPDGHTQPLTAVEGDGTETSPFRYEVAVRYNDTLAEAYRDSLLDFAEKYAAFMQGDGSFSAFASYLDETGTLYEQIKTTPVYFVWDHDGYDIENATAAEFYAYDAGTFSARIRYTHVLRKAGMEDYRDYTDMTLYLRKIGNTYKIYQMENH